MNRMKRYINSKKPVLEKWFCGQKKYPEYPENPVHPSIGNKE